MINKKNRDNYYTIYGVNNCINFLRSKKRFESVNILINKQGNAAKNNKLISLLHHQTRRGTNLEGNPADTPQCRVQSSKRVKSLGRRLDQSMCVIANYVIAECLKT